MKRYRVNKFRDKKFFSRTANKTKAINVPLKTYRGGVRL